MQRRNQWIALSLLRGSILQAWPLTRVKSGVGCCYVQVQGEQWGHLAWLQGSLRMPRVTTESTGQQGTLDWAQLDAWYGAAGCSSFPGEIFQSRNFWNYLPGSKIITMLLKWHASRQARTNYTSLILDSKLNRLKKTKKVEISGFHLTVWILVFKKCRKE